MKDADKNNVVGKGLAASPGAAAGKIVFTAEDAVIEGMHYAQGILTVRGGMTSHAAVVARGMGTCCVSGCGAITIDEKNKVST